jgi:proteasome-associated ATPase
MPGAIRPRCELRLDSSRQRKLTHSENRAMPETITRSTNALSLLEQVLRAPPRSRMEALTHALMTQPELADPTARELLGRCTRQEEALKAADAAIAELGATIETLTQPPRTVAGVATRRGNRVVVAVGGSRQEVGIAPELREAPPEPGEAVLLNREGTAILERLPGFLPGGRVATVRGRHGGRLLVEAPGEQTVAVELASSLEAVKPAEGDRVLVVDEWKMAVEVVERADAPRGSGLEPIALDRIGGLNREIDELMLAIEARFLHAELAEELGLEPLTGALLVGPPGVGKTLLVRGVAGALIARGHRVAIENVAPGSWRHPLYGMTDRIIVEPIERAKRRVASGEVDLMILFYDELDSLGSRSSDISSRIDSRVLPVLLHAIDGVTGCRERRQILLFGATNREDLVDEALLRSGRFGGLTVRISRPDREAARAIFRCHLGPETRFRHNGEAIDPEAMVERCIAAALAPLYADADPADALAELVLAGGRRQPVWARDVVSGALIANVVNRARMLALKRGLIGPRGLVPEDLARAVDAELDAIASRLADPNKAREILGDRTLPVAQGHPRRRRAFVPASA